MRTALIVHASRHGGTEGIAEQIGRTLRASGIEAVVASASSKPDPGEFDAVLIGSGVYMGRWLADGVQFIQRYQATLATKPVWLFSSGPLKGTTVEKPGSNPLEEALGPEDGPGSGGRKQITALAAGIHARENHVFFGAFDPTAPPTNVPERIIRLVPFAKGILPSGDFREWDVIEAWALEIANELREQVPTLA